MGYYSEVDKKREAAKHGINQLIEDINKIINPYTDGYEDLTQEYIKELEETLVLLFQARRKIQ